MKKRAPRSQKKPQPPKSSALDEMAPEMTPKLMKELIQMPVEEIKKKVAEKQAFLERLNDTMVQKMNHLTKLAELRAEFEVEMKLSKRHHAKKRQIATEGTQNFKEAQVSWIHVILSFDLNIFFLRFRTTGSSMNSHASKQMSQPSEAITRRRQESSSKEARRWRWKQRAGTSIVSVQFISGFCDNNPFLF